MGKLLEGYRGPIKPLGAWDFKYYGFKRGDLVRCIQSRYSGYEAGEVYELISLKDFDREYSWNDPDELCLRYTGDSGFDGAFILHERPDLDLFSWGELHN